VNTAWELSVEAVSEEGDLHLWAGGDREGVSAEVQTDLSNRGDQEAGLFFLSGGK